MYLNPDSPRTWALKGWRAISSSLPSAIYSARPARPVFIIAAHSFAKRPRSAVKLSSVNIIRRAPWVVKKNISSTTGATFLNRTDAAGKPYTAVEIQLVKNGGGYLLYRYPRPGNGTEGRLKISYVEAVDDTYWIGAGIYTSEERLIDPGLREFIAGAKTFAAENGRTIAAAEFNNRSGRFIRGDLYVFAYDYNGTVLAWPYRPDQIGVNRRNDTDPVGTHHIQAMIAAARSFGT